MQIRMLLSTNWEGQRLLVGSVLVVDDNVAERWIANRIAEPVALPRPTKNKAAAEKE